MAWSWQHSNRISRWKHTHMKSIFLTKADPRQKVTKAISHSIWGMHHSYQFSNDRFSLLTSTFSIAQRWCAPDKGKQKIANLAHATFSTHPRNCSWKNFQFHHSKGGCTDVAPTKVHLDNLESGGLAHTVVPINLQCGCKVNGQPIPIVAELTQNVIGIVGAHNT